MPSQIMITLANPPVSTMYGEIVCHQPNEDRMPVLILKTLSDTGPKLYERAMNNNQLFSRELLKSRDELLVILEKTKCLVGLVPQLSEMGALPITVFQITSILTACRGSVNNNESFGGAA